MTTYLHTFLIWCNNTPLMVLQSNVGSTEGRLVTRLHTHACETYSPQKPDIYAEHVTAEKAAGHTDIVRIVIDTSRDEDKALRSAKDVLDTYFAQMPELL
ncbi:MAG: hypothetical protein DI628_04160 [Blastochloris viridis]|uniref:Uncharacterized protein n=1 Tax=Blastochloris viridis TaxID=1079 RepID=A0A6N4R619_BLAVI|nr:MAG: hypothetical protein DI628_04160 [Blastochloris viridis]